MNKAKLKKTNCKPELFKAETHLLDAALESVHALGLEAKDSAHLTALIHDAHKRRCLK